MQIATDGTKYDERQSKDSLYSYTISFNPANGIWSVDCWIEASGDNHWNRMYHDEDKAIKEYNRFE